MAGRAPEDKMTAYAILGGLPGYLEQFDNTASIEHNVKTNALRRNTYLSEEPDCLLLEDMRRDNVYGPILRAIAHGERKPSDIARAIGKNSAQDIAGLDIVAVDDKGAVTLIGECKWTNAPVDVFDYASMLKDIQLAASELNADPESSAKGGGPWLAFFSRSGFSPSLEQLAAEQTPQRLLLVSLELMYSQRAINAYISG